MNCYFIFSGNNYCWCAIIDQTYSNVRAEQWPNFQLTVAYSTSTVNFSYPYNIILFHKPLQYQLAYLHN